MPHRRLRALAVAITGITAAVPAFAQLDSTVTVAPVSAGAPALGWPGLGILALALACGAVLMLRRSDRSVARAVGLVTVLLAAAVGYATVPDVTISGGECHEVTQKSYPSLSSPDLVSQCSNPIRIIDLQLNCTDAKASAPLSDGGPPCEVGLVIPPMGICRLPTCAC